MTTMHLKGNETPKAPHSRARARLAARNKEDDRWHELPSDEALRLLDVDPRTGLSNDEAERRLVRFGFNRITPRPPIAAWRRFLKQFNQPLVYLLLAAVVVAASLREWVDASVIFGVVLVNAVVGFFQEAKAEGAIAALTKLITSTVTVRRDGFSL